VELTARAAGRTPRFADYEPATWVLAMIGWRASAVELEHARAAAHEAGRVMGEFHCTYDLFLTPTLARPPARVGELALQPGERFQIHALRFVAVKAVLDHALATMAKEKLAATPNTQLFNQTGQPAISLPLFWNAEGLPVGVQLAAPVGGEGTLFRVARQLELARPWAGRLPAMVTAG
jgi:amidase